MSLDFADRVHGQCSKSEDQIDCRANCKTHLPVKIALLGPFKFTLLTQPTRGWVRRSESGKLACPLK